MNGIEANFRLQFHGFQLEAAFDAPGTGVTALFGPSGSGKTTLLRCVAGLERAQDGYLRMNGEVWQEGRYFLPSHRRRLGYVFQEASLFPHLNVRDNLEYGWKRIPTDERRVSFDQAVTLLGIADMLGRDPARLSGGERQRVAIARALLTSPRLLLMDEPLSALDGQSKAEILPYLERLYRELDIPVLYVSHSVDEVARLADHMVLMEKGRVRAAGPLSDLITRLDMPLAHDDTAEAIIDAVVAGHDETFNLTYASFSGGTITLPRQQLEPGRPVRVRIHARDVSLAMDLPQRSSILNIFSATVQELSVDRVGQVTVRLDAEGVPLLARVTGKSAAALELAPGLRVFAQVKSVALLD
jgi:molybdate transport system ATP-binding protein